MVYTGGRFALFLVCALLLWSGAGVAGFHLNGLPLLLASLLVSSVLSLFLLREQRDRLAVAVAAKRDEKTAQIAARRARLETDGDAP